MFSGDTFVHSVVKSAPPVSHATPHARQILFKELDLTTFELHQMSIPNQQRPRLDEGHQRKQSACHRDSQRYHSLKQLIRLVRDRRRQDIIFGVFQHCRQIEQLPNLDLNDANGFALSGIEVSAPCHQSSMQIGQILPVSGGPLRL